MRKVLKKFKNSKDEQKYRRRISIRKKVKGTADVPRICLNKTNKNLLAQIVNDELSVTLFSVGTYGKALSEAVKKNVEGAKAIGCKVAEVMKDKNLKRAVFDRNGNKYTGIAKAFVDSVRENGISI